MTNIKIEHWEHLKNDNEQEKRNVNGTIINSAIAEIRNDSDLLKFTSKRPRANMTNMLTRKPTTREISNAIKTLKNHKSRGIAGAVCKATHTWIVSKLFDLYADMRDNNKLFPNDWAEARVVFIYKK